MYIMMDDVNPLCSFIVHSAHEAQTIAAIAEPPTAPPSYYAHQTGTLVISGGIYTAGYSALVRS